MIKEYKIKSAKIISPNYTANSGIIDGSIKEITIPEEITKLKENLFYYCTELNTINLPDTIRSIGKDAFYQTGYYKNNNNWSDEMLYVGKYLVDSNYNYLEPEITIREGTLGIADGVFSYASITKINLPEGLKFLGEESLYSCKKLTNVVIPESVETIGYRALYGCNALTEITIPFTGESRDGNETNLGYIFGTKDSYYNSNYIPSTLKKVTITSKIGKYGLYSCENITNVIISDGISDIPQGAFGFCYNVTHIEVPNTVTSIGQQAFYECTNLTEINIPDGVYKIDKNAFNGCNSLTSIKIPSSLTKIEYGAFEYCYGLKEIEIPDNIVEIDGFAFFACKGIENIIFGSGVQSIGRQTFSYCDNLVSVEIPSNVLVIDRAAFYGNENLKNLTLNFGLETIGDYAFQECGFTEINYNGTKSQWNNISKGTSWYNETPLKRILCTDGIVELEV